MMAGDKFLRFGLMATAAIAGRHDRGNVGSVVIEAVHVPFIGEVAFYAADSFYGMRTALPVIDDPR